MVLGKSSLKGPDFQKMLGTCLWKIKALSAVSKQAPRMQGTENCYATSHATFVFARELLGGQRTLLAHNPTRFRRQKPGDLNQLREEERFSQTVENGGGVCSPTSSAIAALGQVGPIS